MAAARAPYLFRELKIGDLVIKNRIVLAPLTRGRAGETRMPNDLMKTYYTQRAGAGLIISEATAISPQGYGWYHSPGIYNETMAAAWKKVTDAVMAIAVGADGPTPGGTYGTTTSVGVAEQYRTAAAFAKQGGFDGLEIHSANGYLLDQFLQSCSNKRTDAYGGSKENRYRLLGEVVEAVKTVWPANRIGVRLSPNGVYGGMGSEDNYDMFTYVAQQLRVHGLAYLHVLDGLEFGFHKECSPVIAYDVKKHFEGPVMANVCYTRDTADGAIRSGAVDLVAFGRPFISNPDLPLRFAKNLPLAPDAPISSWYGRGGGEKGYTDWPTA